jgi:hypothetical protein
MISQKVKLLPFRSLYSVFYLKVKWITKSGPSITQQKQISTVLGSAIG